MFFCKESDHSVKDNLTKRSSDMFTEKSSIDAVITDLRIVLDIEGTMSYHIQGIVAYLCI